jgi:hypothetical protein
LRFQRHELLNNPGLSTAIDKAHFELQHINRRLQILQDHRKTGRFDPTPTDLVQALFEKAGGHYETLRIRDLLKPCCASGGGWDVSREDFHLLEMVVGTIELAVGLSAISGPAPLIPDGGAVNWCKEAIREIDLSLGTNGRSPPPVQ